MTTATTKDLAVPSLGSVITRPVGIGGPLVRVERAVRTVREGRSLGGELRPRLQDGLGKNPTNPRGPTGLGASGLRAVLAATPHDEG